MGKYQAKDGPYWISPCEREDCPTEGWHAHAEDVDGVQIPTEMVEEVVLGPVVADNAYRTLGSTDTFAAPAVAAHYDASDEYDEPECACGADFADRAQLRVHITEANAR